MEKTKGYIEKDRKPFFKTITMINHSNTIVQKNINNTLTNDTLKAKTISNISIIKTYNRK